MLEHREGGCHCGRVRFRAQIDLDLLPAGPTRGSTRMTSAP